MIDLWNTQAAMAPRQVLVLRSAFDGSVRNEGDVRQIGGFSIDITGSLARLVKTEEFTAGRGIGRITSSTPPNVLSPSNSAALIQLQEVAYTQRDLDAVRQKDASPYIAAVPLNVDVIYAPVGAEPQPVESLGFIPGEVLQSGSTVDYVRGQITRAGELARIEDRFSAEYGHPVKIAYDPLGQDYVMLRPGQSGYDRVAGAREALERISVDIGKLGNVAPYRDILAKYGIG